MDSAFFQWFYPLITGLSLTALLGTAIKRKADSALCFGIASVLLLGGIGFVMLNFGFSTMVLTCRVLCIDTDELNYLLMSVSLISDSVGIVVLIRSLRD